jgi:hypothetical protein
LEQIASNRIAAGGIWTLWREADSKFPFRFGPFEFEGGQGKHDLSNKKIYYGTMLELRRLGA